MAKNKNAFYDTKAKTFSVDDVENLFKMQDEANQKKKEDVNKETTDFNKGLKYSTLPALSDASKKKLNNSQTGVKKVENTQKNTTQTTAKTQQTAQKQTTAPANTQSLSTGRTFGKQQATASDKAYSGGRGTSKETQMQQLASKDKLTKEEKKTAKSAYKELKKYGIEQNTDNQRKKLQTAIDSGELSADYVKNVTDAYYKSSGEGSVAAGLAAFGQSFAKPIINTGAFLEKASGNKNGSWNNARNYEKEQYEEVTKAHPIAETAGMMAGETVKNVAAGSILGGTKVFSKVGEGLSKVPVLGKVGAEKLGEFAANQATDLVIDTLPNELMEGYVDDKSAGEIAKNAAINIGLNTGMNVATDILPTAVKGGYKRFKEFLKSKGVADEVAETVAKNVVENADNAKALDNINAEQSQIDDITETLIKNGEQNLPILNKVDDGVQANAMEDIIRNTEPIAPQTLIDNPTVNANQTLDEIINGGKGDLADRYAKISNIDDEGYINSVREDIANNNTSDLRRNLNNYIEENPDNLADELLNENRAIRDELYDKAIVDSNGNVKYGEYTLDNVDDVKALRDSLANSPDNQVLRGEDLYEREQGIAALDRWIANHTEDVAKNTTTSFIDKVPSDVQNDLTNILANSKMTDTQKKGIETAVNRYYETGELFNLSSAEKLAGKNGDTETTLFINDLINKQIDDVNSPYGKLGQTNGSPFDTPKADDFIEGDELDFFARENAKKEPTSVRVDKLKTDDTTYKGIRSQLDSAHKNVKFNSAEETNAFIDATNRMELAYEKVLDSKTDTEWVQNVSEFEKAYREARDIFRQGYVEEAIDTGKTKAKKEFREQTKGIVIKLTDELRNEEGLKDKSIPSLNSWINARIGREADNIRFSTTKGTSIDALPEIKELVDPTGETRGNEADYIKKLLDHIDGLSGTNVEKQRIPAEDLDILTDDIWDSISDDANAKFYGEKVLAEDIGLNSETDEAFDSVLDTAEEEFVPPTFDTNFTEEYGGRFGTPKKSTEKVSKLYSNTLEREVDPDVFARTYDRNAFKYDTTSNAELAERAAQIIDMNGIDNEIDRLYNLENFSAQDVATAGMIHDFLLKNGYEEEAFDFARQIRPNMSTATASALQAHKMWSLSTPEGALNEAIMNIDNSIDKKHLTGGYSDAVNNVSDAVKDAVENGDMEALDTIFDGTLGDYSTKSSKWRGAVKNKKITGKQQVLDIINSAKNTKKSPAELAEECAKVVANKLGGNTLTRTEEHEVLNLLKQMSEYEPSSREYKEIQAKAMSIVQNAMPSTLGNKVKNILYTNMLGNIRTALTRNFGGNAFANAIEGVQKPLRTAMDKALSAKTGVRNYIYDKEITEEGIKGFGKGFADQAADIKAGIQTTRSGENTLKDALSEGTKAYKYNGNKFHDFFAKGANKYVDTVRDVMKFGDRPFYEGQYAAAKKELEKIVERYGDDAIQRAGAPDGVSTDDLIEFWAHERALEACYQNGSLTSNGMTKLKQGLGEMSKDWLGFDIMSQTTSPFVQVPGNMISRGVQYTPLGVLGNAVKTTAEMATGNFNQKRFVDTTSRNLVGLGMSGGALAAAHAGLTTGAYSEDKDKATAQRNAGELEYALNILGKQIDMSDIPIVGGKIQGAAQMYDILKKNMNVDDETLTDIIISNYENGTLAEALSAGIKGDIEAQVGTSAMQGYNRLFGGNSSYSTTDSLMDNVTDTIKSAGTQLVPSLLRQGAAYSDRYKRDLGEYGSNEYYENLVKNSIPGLRQTMPIKIDAQAKPILQNQGREGFGKAMENFVLPYTISEPQYSAMNEEANRLSEALGTDGDIAYTPNITRTMGKEILGDNFTEKNYYDLRKKYGNTDTQIGNLLLNNKDYQQLDDRAKAEAFELVHKTAKSYVKELNGIDTGDKYAKAFAESPEKAAEMIIQKQQDKMDQTAMETSAEAGYLDNAGLKLNDKNYQFAQTHSESDVKTYGEVYNSGTKMAQWLPALERKHLNRDLAYDIIMAQTGGEVAKAARTYKSDEYTDVKDRIVNYYYDKY